MTQGEWRFHPQTMKMIWKVFGQEEVDIFASAEDTQCTGIFSMTEPSTLGVEVLAHSCPRAHKYAFPPVNILNHVLCRIRQEKEPVLLSAPNWPTQPWFLDLLKMLLNPPCPIPLRKRPPLPNKWLSLAPQSGTMGLTCLAAQRRLHSSASLPQ